MLKHDIAIIMKTRISKAQSRKNVGKFCKKNQPHINIYPLLKYHTNESIKSEVNQYLALYEFNLNISFYVSWFLEQQITISVLNIQRDFWPNLMVFLFLTFQFEVREHRPRMLLFLKFGSGLLAQGPSINDVRRFLTILTPIPPNVRFLLSNVQFFGVISDPPSPP